MGNTVHGLRGLDGFHGKPFLNTKGHEGAQRLVEWRNMRVSFRLSLVMIESEEPQPSITHLRYLRVLCG